MAATPSASKAFHNVPPHSILLEILSGAGASSPRPVSDRSTKAHAFAGIGAGIEAAKCGYLVLLSDIQIKRAKPQDFDRLRATDAALLTDLERAARFLYLQRASFGGVRSSFGVQPGLPGRFDVSKLTPQLAELNERLAGVTIENLHYADFIERFDGVDVLFYLDPPYFGSENDYGAGIFSRRDFGRLAEILAAIKGRFILSINETDETRRIFAAFEQESVDVTYSIAEASPKLTRELIISTPGLRRSAEMQPQLFD